MSTVSDSSPLIALNSIGRLDLLRLLFDEVTVPPAVAREVQRFSLPGWIHVKALSDSRSKPVLSRGLGPGETEAILLGLELQPNRIILDDGAARSTARSHGLRVIGVLGILLSAKNLGAISSVRDEVDRLMTASFRVSSKVYRDLLVHAGETDNLTMYP